MRFNPMSWYVERLRDVLLFGDFSLSASDLMVPAFTLLVLGLGFRFFRRISGHFEDFL
jgi:ABC-type polysaccharide/polyol phosphate export permease